MVLHHGPTCAGLSGGRAHVPSGIRTLVVQDVDGDSWGLSRIPCPLALTGVPGPPARVCRGEHNPLASRRRPRGFAAAAVGSARRLRPFGRALPTATAAKPHGLRLAGCSVPTRAGPERPPPGRAALALGCQP